MTLEEFQSDIEELLEGGEFKVVRRGHHFRLTIGSADKEGSRCWCVAGFGAPCEGHSPIISPPFLFCPLTALCLAKCGELHGVSHYKEAGLRLGLTMEDLKAVTRAADWLDEKPKGKTAQLSRLFKAAVQAQDGEVIK